MAEKRYSIDCSKFPSESGCSLKISGREEELLTAATAHAVSVHGHKDSPELRSELRSAFVEELVPV